MKLHEHALHYAHRFFEHARETLKKKAEAAKEAYKRHEEQNEKKKDAISTSSVEMKYKKAEVRKAMIRHAVAQHKKHHFAKGQTSPRQPHPLIAHAVKGFMAKTKKRR